MPDHLLTAQAGITFSWAEPDNVHFAQTVNLAQFLEQRTWHDDNLCH